MIFSESFGGSGGKCFEFQNSEFSFESKGILCVQLFCFSKRFFFRTIFEFWYIVLVCAFVQLCFISTQRYSLRSLAFRNIFRLEQSRRCKKKKDHAA